jgi:hypothetical protein
MGAPALQRVPAFQLVLSDAQFRAIGHVTVQWAFLEAEIDAEMLALLEREEHKEERIDFRTYFKVRVNRWPTSPTGAIRQS